jgi:hypothetical protein
MAWDISAKKIKYNEIYQHFVNTSIDLPSIDEFIYFGIIDQKGNTTWFLHHRLTPLNNFYNHLSKIFEKDNIRLSTPKEVPIDKQLSLSDQNVGDLSYLILS